MSMVISGDNGLTFPAGSTQVQAGNYQTMVNRIINPRMEIDQRNAGASVTANDGVFPVDRFRFSMTQSSKGNGQQSTVAPAGFINSLLFTSTAATSLGAGDSFNIRHVIEGFNTADLMWGTADAKTVTLSFWVRSSLTGTFGGALANQAWTRSYPFTYTISSANTWEQKSITISGDTTGTWNTNNLGSINIWIGLGVGTTRSGTAGSWSGSDFRSATGATSVVGTNGATFYITGVDLRVGSYTVVPQDFRAYGTELALCQRYFEVVHAGITGYVAGSSAFMFTPFKVQKRATPTMTDVGTSYGGITLTGALTLNASGFTFADNYTTTLTSAEQLGAASASMLRYNTLQTASAEL